MVQICKAEDLEDQAAVVQEALIVAQHQDKVMADQAEMEASMAAAEAAEKAAQVAAVVLADQEHHITDTQLQAAVAVEDLVDLLHLEDLELEAAEEEMVKTVLMPK